MSKTYCIYKHTNKINGKIYIGQTCQKPEYRWGSHGQFYTERQPAIYAAIQKYGWENFEHEILEENLTQDEANVKETYWIQYYKSNINGYNLTEGGERAIVSQSTKDKQSTARKEYLKEHPETMPILNKAAAKARSKPVLCIETGIIYPSAAEAGRQLGINGKNICAVCTGKRKLAKGCHWQYVQKN